MKNVLDQTILIIAGSFGRFARVNIAILSIKLQNAQ